MYQRMHTRKRGLLTGENWKGVQEIEGRSDVEKKIKQMNFVAMHEGQCSHFRNFAPKSGKWRIKPTHSFKVYLSPLPTVAGRPDRCTVPQD